ncbi:MAG: RDD family protein [Gammaproteobacteria bacterium]|nr:RDD family protein [Gammaproteobacteria bacterium]
MPPFPSDSPRVHHAAPRTHRHDAPHAGLPRRLAALVYDALLLFGVLFAAGAPVVALVDAAVLPGGRFHVLYQAYLAAVIYLFFGWFWTHGGQTLGMRAWRLRVQRPDGTTLGWGRALVRLLAAVLSAGALGLGYLWILVDREGLAWHDRVSGSCLVVSPRRRG